MRALLFALGTAFLCGMTSPGIAADLAIPQRKEAVVPQQAVTQGIACLRWIEQTYSWYNYCDPIPYYGRQKYSWSGSLF